MVQTKYIMYCYYRCLNSMYSICKSKQKFFIYLFIYFNRLSTKCDRLLFSLRRYLQAPLVLSGSFTWQ